MQTPAEQLYGAPLPSLSQKRPDLPPELETIMAKALANDPGARYPDASALGEALRDLARRHGLLYSAPLLAIELRELLGPDPATWSHDETVGGETERMPAARTLEGREATSLKEAEEPLGTDDLPGENTVSLRPASPTEPNELAPSPEPEPLPPPPALLHPPDRTATPIVGPAASPPRSPFRRRMILIAYLLVVGAGIAAGALWTMR
jgi:hypothetical protein